MTRKSLNKLLSVILTLAICFTTVFGCLMTVNAAACCYSWTAGKTVSTSLSTATINLQFTPADLSYGINRGFFKIESNNWSLADVKIDSATLVDGTYVASNYFADCLTDDNGVKTGEVEFGVNNTADIDSEELNVKSITFELTLTFNGGTAEYGEDYSVSVTNIMLGNSNEVHNHGSGTATGTITAGCMHTYQYSKGTLFKTNTIEGYKVYKDVPCTLCGEINPYQVVPTTAPKSVLYWDGTVGSKPTKTSGGYTIISTAAELAYVANTANLTGKFKIADGIDAIVLQKNVDADSNGVDDVMELADYAQTKAYFETNGANLKPWASDGIFQGTFDGNGVEIYGLYSTSSHAGLFGRVNEGTTITNVTVKNSYFNGSTDAAALVAVPVASTAYSTKVMSAASGDARNAVCDGYVNFEKCVIANCYVTTPTKVNNNGNHRVGVMMAGNVGYINVSMNNCLVYGNHAVGYLNGKAVEAGLFAKLSGSHNGDKFSLPNGIYSNSVILDCTPYANGQDVITDRPNQAFKPSYYTNVYTNCITTVLPNKANGANSWDDYLVTKNGDYNRIIIIDRDAAKGVNGAEKLDLDWYSDTNTTGIWRTDHNGGYPIINVGANASTTISTGSSATYRLYAANIDYNTDGTFNFNFYYRGSSGLTTSTAPILYVGRADGTGFTKLTAKQLTANVIENNDVFADAGITIKSGYKYFVYTITDISAREIGDTLLPTAVKVGNSVQWGKSEQISVADYATKILTDNSVSAADKQVAASLVNYGNAAKAALETPDASPTKTVYWSGGYGSESSIAALNDTKAGGKSWEDAIIIDNAEELYWLTRVSTSDVTKGLYFKVHDDIKNFILQPQDYVDANKLMAMTDAEEVKAYLNSLSNCKVWGSYGSFDGNFDGNGATVYGMRGNSNSGLFALIDGGTPNLNEYYTLSGKDYYSDYVGITIKNINVKNSWLSSGWRMGGIIAGTHDADSGADVAGTINLDSCSVANCYFDNDGSINIQTGNGQNQNASSKGLLVGAPNQDQLLMSNCLTYGNKVSITVTPSDNTWTDNSTWTHADRLSIVGLYADMARPDSSHSRDYAKRRRNILTNSIILGGLPHNGTKNSENNSVPACLEYVYTDQADAVFDNYADTDLKLISATDAIGSSATTACPKLGWGIDWIVGYDGEYPTPVQRSITTEGKTIYWSGGNDTILADNGETGDSWENAIIIDSAEELRQVALRTDAANSAGKYYKLADGIDKIIMQPKGTFDDLSELLSITSGADVQKYFENTIGLDNLTNWNTERQWFSGNFDGNGVEIYGLFGDGRSTGHSGLFSTTDGGGDGDKSTYETDTTGMVLKNFTIKNSYFVSNDRLGAIVDQTCGQNYGSGVLGVVNLDGCAVINSYMHHTEKTYSSGYCGVMTGDCGNDIIKINNCMVYGNKTSDMNGDALLLRSNLPSDAEDTDGKYIYNTVSNSIIFGTSPYTSTMQYRRTEPQCYSNVYTDFPDGNVYNTSNTNHIFTAEQLKHVDEADLFGSKAIDTLPDNWDWNTSDNTDGVWYTGNEYDGLPGFKPAGIMNTASQAIYDGIVLSTYDNYAVDGTTDISFGIYSTSVNLKNNPYLGITFMFNHQYKENRKSINITLSTVDSSGATTQIKNADDMRIPDYKAGEYISDVNNWTNKNGAGKYHLYTLKDLDITDLSKTIKIVMTYSGKTVTSTVSLEGLGLDMQNAYLRTGSQYYANCAEAIKALMFYSQALEARYG